LTTVVPLKPLVQIMDNSRFRISWRRGARWKKIVKTSVHE
jgi:hypothetical protein